VTGRTLLRHGLLQRRVLREPVGGLLHLLLVASVVVLTAGSLYAQLDNRVLKPLGGSLPRGRTWVVLQGLLDLAGLVLLLAAVGLLLRRLFARPEHLPRSATTSLLLLGLAVVAASGFALEGLRMSQQSSNDQAWSFVGRGVAGWIGPDPGLLDGSSGGPRLTLWRWLLWGHALLAMGLVAVLPWTRLRHAILAPFHVARRPDDRVDAPRLPFRLDELAATGSYEVRFGVVDGGDLEDRRLELAACADCGRCEASCPVHRTGGALSPRAVVAELAAAVRTADPGRLPAQLAEAAVWSCLQCGACSEACPTLLQPHLLLLELRRGMLRTGRSSAGPDRVLSGLARSGNPYGQPRWAREELADDLGLPLLEEQPDADWLLWVGCAGTYDARIKLVVAATAAALRRAGLSVAILGEEECCTGDPARRSGEEARFQELAGRNLATLAEFGVERIVTCCPHCLQSLRTEHAALGPVPEVVHHSELLARLIDEGRLEIDRPGADRATLHDPCYLARFGGVTEAPRRLVQAATTQAVELPERGRRTACCGGGGPSYHYDVERVAGVAEARLAQAVEVGADVVVTACPFCLKMLDGAVCGDDGPIVRDIVELLTEERAR
jgi:Fe-S oxidoreductase